MVLDIQNQLDYLRQKSPHPFQVDEFRKGHELNPSVDRFSVLVPCFLDYVRWEVVYNYCNPSWPPDIIFGEDDAEFQPLATSESAANLLRRWNVREPANLLNLLLELRAQYLLYQLKRVEKLDVSRLVFECNTLHHLQGVEVGVIKENDSLSVKFCIPLPDIDFGTLARECRITSPLQPVVLEAKFPVQAHPSSPPFMKLHVPFVLREVFDVHDVKMPAWAEDMCLFTYLPVLREALDMHINEARTSLSLRRIFIEALPAVFGRPLEAETDSCKSVSMIASVLTFTFLVHMSLSHQFPKVKPALVLQSSQHFDPQNRPISRAYEEYPWSPRWDTEEMVSRICDFIVGEINNFRTYCNEYYQH